MEVQSYQWQTLENTLRSICELYNYDEIRTPIFEHTNVFKRENDSSDMVNKEMYTFQLENSKTSLTIRPEGTAGVVRSFVEIRCMPTQIYLLNNTIWVLWHVMKDPKKDVYVSSINLV